jgi:carboxylesterase
MSGLIDREKSNSVEQLLPGAEPFELGGGELGVLLLHGFGDTPQTLRYLAETLSHSGYTVRVPLLPGHGRTVQAFHRSSAHDWIDAARQELRLFRTRFDAIGLGGLSMGGAIASIIAAEETGPSALVLIAPYLAMPPVLRLVAAMPAVFDPVVRRVSARSPLSIRDPQERAKNLAYGTSTASTLHELAKIVRHARESLPRISMPTLLIQSREDNRIKSQVAERAFADLGADEKQLVMTTAGGHVITVDYGRDRVAAEVRQWLDKYVREKPVPRIATG